MRLKVSGESSAPLRSDRSCRSGQSSCLRGKKRQIQCVALDGTVYSRVPSHHTLGFLSCLGYSLLFLVKGSYVSGVWVLRFSSVYFTSTVRAEVVHRESGYRSS